MIFGMNHCSFFHSGLRLLFRSAQVQFLTRILSHVSLQRFVPTHKSKTKFEWTSTFFSFSFPMGIVSEYTDFKFRQIIAHAEIDLLFNK